MRKSLSRSRSISNSISSDNLCRQAEQLDAIVLIALCEAEIMTHIRRIERVNMATAA